MLKSLRVKELALVEEAELDFEPGFNVLTGETGAGKTVLIGALKLLMGEKKTHSLVRTGAEKAMVEGVFILDPDERQSLAKIISEELEEIVLTREVSREGRDKLYLNGRLIPLSLGSKIGQHLIQLYGQNEHQALLRKSSHLDYLDSFAGADLKELKLLFRENFKSWEKVKKELEEKQKLAENRKEKQDYLRFQLEEIKKASLTEGEEDKLKEEREVLRNQEKIVASLNKVLGLLSQEETNALDLLGQAVKEAEKISSFGSQFGEVWSGLLELLEKGNEVSGAVEVLLGNLTFEPRRLEELEERLYLISILKKKYGATVTEILKRQTELEKELASLEQVSFDLEDLERKEKILREKVKNLAFELSKLRKKTASELEKKIARVLPLLGFKGCSVRVETKPREAGDFLSNLTVEGLDEVELFFQPGLKEEIKPLKDIASGGELSRLMLALRTVHPDFLATRTAVFDEVDAGIGGLTAQKVGQHLSELALKSQVLCVTHLPQIASRANCHFLVQKEESRGRMVTKVRKLLSEERVEEIARLLSGTITAKALEHAREILKEARQSWARL